MKNILICTVKSWNFKEANWLRKKLAGKYNVTVISDNRELLNIVNKITPCYIFFPHWPYIIPKEIYMVYKCVVFHMTDLPYGRGGSPLQNLIARGIENTKISAIDVEEKIDAGAVYMKEDLNLMVLQKRYLFGLPELYFIK